MTVRTGSPEPTKRATARNVAPPAAEDETIARAIEAVGRAEDIGSLEWSAPVRSLTEAVICSGRLGAEGRWLTVEMAKIFAGRSDVSPESADWRFKDPAWRENLAYRRVAQTYLAATQALERLSVSERLDWRTAERARMAVSLVSSALAPTNTLPGNPAAIKRTFDTSGANLVRGFRNFVSDLRHNGGMPSQVDKSSFEVGKNLAATPGAVVYRDEICEVIQYRPSTAHVRARPVLMIPPQINRYYFMDLGPRAQLHRACGVLEGEALAKVFTWLRPNDLVWNYWVNNYLMGNDPPAFDILAWNSDSTRLTGALHALARLRCAGAHRRIALEATVAGGAQRVVQAPVPKGVRAERPLHARRANRAGSPGGFGNDRVRHLRHRRCQRPHHALARLLSDDATRGGQQHIRAEQRRAHRESR
jgi:Poly-beta-hydroxybutyrate polymerase (PhaC) N-terminus